MNYQDWLPLFGLPATDPKVIAALAANGVTAPVTLPPETSATGIDFKPHGYGVGFTSEFTLRAGVAGLPILSSVVIKTIPNKNAKGWTPYSGALPHGLTKNDSKDVALTKLGKPAVLSDAFFSGRWEIDGIDLGVSFSDDWQKIKQLGLSLPGSR